MKIHEAVRFFGGKKKLAVALKTSPAAVSQWREKIPLGRQYQIQIITNGQLKADQQAAA